MILAIVSFAGLLAPLASTIYFPALETIAEDLETTGQVMDLTIGVFILVLGFFPLIWGGAADRYGRRWIFISSLLLFLASNIGAALAQSIGVLIAMRVLQGVGSSAPLVIGVGVVSDVFPKEELGMSVSIFFSGLLVGPILGPILGGYMNDALGWRSTFWFLAIAGGLTNLLVLLFLPETLEACQPFPIRVSINPPRISKVGAFFNPFAALKYLRFPVVVLAGFIPGLAFATFFGIESFHSRAFRDKYELSPSNVGLSFLVLGIGSIIGNFLGGKLSDLMSARANKTSSNNPEARLHGVWAFVVILILGILTYGWSLETNLHLAIPLAATFFIGFGYTACSIGASAYLVNLAPDYSSSITSSANFIKMTLAAIIVFNNTGIVNLLRYGYGSVLYGAVAFFAIIITLLLVLKGQALRQATGPYLPSE
ncbi:hypothetical protein DSO57_1035504 [Entomophthora muscae]|uniref:Uncharacterized protein n=1 Tax=Entomophthora muscae TaxID=34485 RepID=A0ACC2S1P8_9FUNG|nr:hypothetical protein DSO57_1035504 [Entomophthora muscae]